MTLAAGTLPSPVPDRRVNAPLGWRIRNFPRWWSGYWRVALAVFVAKYFTHLPVIYGRLRIEVRRANGVIEDYGVVGYKVVTTTGAGFIVDAFQNLVELENMKFHGFGTGSNAEAVGNTALHTELTTEYATDNTRPTGTQTENGSTVYETVGVLDPDAAVAITEHGIFSQASNAGGVLLDKTLFSVINLAASGDTLTATYDFTVTTGG